MAHVLVTGSLGYLGSRLCPHLEREGFQVTGYDPGFFREGTVTAPQDPPTRPKDVRQMTEQDLDGIHAVVHLAGISNDPFGAMSPEAIYDPTRAYTRWLAGACKRRGIRFVFASSCSVYGIGGSDLVDEDSPTSPQTPYSRNKLQIEGDLLELAGGGFNPVMFRFATVFGMSPRIRFDVVINMLVGMALTSGRIVLNSNGQAWRPHLYIDDVCQAVTLALRRPAPRPLLLNVGDTSQNLRIMDVARAIQAQVPGCELSIAGARAQSAPVPELARDRKIQDGVDTRTYRVAFERISVQLPGFQCRWTVERGIAQLIDDLRRARLTAAQFSDARFYRLQTLERLFAQGRLTPDVQWAAPVERPERMAARG